MTAGELEAAADRGALAAILEARGRDREARAVLVEVLATLERVLGPEHYDLVGVLDRLAAIAEPLRRPGGGRPNCSRAR